MRFPHPPVISDRKNQNNSERGSEEERERMEETARMGESV